MADNSGPRILLVTRNMPPLIGGMERLNWHMADELSRYAKVRVIAPMGAAAVAPPNVSVLEIPLRPLWKFLLGAQWFVWREVLRWRPDWVLAGSGLTALPVWLASRIARTRTAAYVHGLDLTVSHPVYRRFWLPALRRMDHIIANSRATAAVADQIGIEKARVGIVHPGVEMPGELLDGQGVTEFRIKYSLGDRPVLLSVGRLSKRKGLGEFVADALPRVVAKYPNALLLVVGDTPVDALHAEVQSPESIRAIAVQAGVADNVRFLGRVTDQELEVLYRVADIHVFPVREIKGDPEGFGMVAVEAAAHGLPTIAFATGGVVDAVADGMSGYLAQSGDYAMLAGGILRVLASRGSMHSTCIAFAQGFAWSKFGARIATCLLGTDSMLAD
jgi:phosphatidyl-myo-inositol dimannoside synthase